eukprot:9120387-Karenia_brevis.AAC.1
MSGMCHGAEAQMQVESATHCSQDVSPKITQNYILEVLVPLKIASWRLLSLQNPILEAVMAQDLRSWRVLAPKRPQERKEPPRGDQR